MILDTFDIVRAYWDKPSSTLSSAHSFSVAQRITKTQGNTTRTQGLAGLANVRRRTQSFSHLPRPHLSREQFIRYLGDRVSAEHATDSDPTRSGADRSAIAVEEGINGAKNDDTGKDSDPHESDANLVEAGAAAIEGGVACSEVMPRKSLFRRWPSSADLGMITDGR